MSEALARLSRRGFLQALAALPVLHAWRPPPVPVPAVVTRTAFPSPVFVEGVGYWSRALTPAEIPFLWNAGSGLTWKELR